MKKPTPSYQRHRFPSEIISHAVWLLAFEQHQQSNHPNKQQGVKDVLVTH